MLKFHNENHKIFDFYIKVEKGKDSFNKKVLFPENQEIPDIAKNIDIFCFPYQEIIPEEEFQFYLCLTDSSKKQTYVYINRRKTVAYCLLSPFFHPHFFLEIIYRLSGVRDLCVPRACLRYLESKICHDKTDWVASFNADLNEIGVSNLDSFCKYLSPSCELSKLYQFIFNKLPIPYILATLVAMILDCRIVIISSNLSNISIAVFSLIALIYPYHWPGTFIPILPSSILTMLDAPFAYLIGIHSSTADTLLSIDRYFLVNIDFHYCASVGMEDFPSEVLKFINERSDKLKKLINRYLPIFPFVQIQTEIRSFIRDLFGVAYSLDTTDIFTNISQIFNKWKSIPSDEFKALFSQTQFVNTLMNEIDFEHNKDVLQAFWPNCKNHVFVQFQLPPPSPNNKSTPNHSGWKRSRKNSIGKQDFEKIINEDDINESIVNNDKNSNKEFDNSSESNENSSNENDNSINRNNNITNEDKNNENKKGNEELINQNQQKNEDANDSNNISGQEETRLRRKRRKQVNTVQLSSLNLDQLSISNLNSITNLECNYLDDDQQSNSVKKIKRRRVSKHRSQSVENHLIPKNNSYSTLHQHHHHQSAKEAPVPSMTKEYPHLFDETSDSYIRSSRDSKFIDAPDDQNLIPIPRKTPPRLPVPKRPLARASEAIPPDLKQIQLQLPQKDGSQSARVQIHKINSYNSATTDINYNQQGQKSKISPSSSLHSRNTRNSSVEKSSKKNELSMVKKSKRSSSVSLNNSNNNVNQNNKNNNKDYGESKQNYHEHDQNRKRRTHSSSVDTENHISFSPKLSKQKSEQIYALSHHQTQKDQKEPNENRFPKEIKKATKAGSFPEDEAKNNHRTMNRIDNSNSNITNTHAMNEIKYRNRINVENRKSTNELINNVNEIDDKNITRRKNKVDSLRINIDNLFNPEISEDGPNNNTKKFIKPQSIPSESDDKNAPRRMLKSNSVGRDEEKDKIITDDVNISRTKPISSPTKPFKLRPLPTDNKIKDKTNSLHVNSLRPFKQLTPHVLNHSNHNPFDDIDTEDKRSCNSGSEISPTRKIFRNTNLIRSKPKLKLEMSDDNYYSDYYEYEDKLSKKQIKNNNLKNEPVSLSARVNTKNDQKVLPSNSNSATRKRNASFDHPKPSNTVKPESNEKTNNNSNNANCASPKKAFFPVKPRIGGPSARRTLPSKPNQNQPRTPPLIKFSSSSEYSDN